MRSQWLLSVFVASTLFLLGCEFDQGMSSKSESSSIGGIESFEKPELKINQLAPDSNNLFQARLNGSCDKKGSQVRVSGDILNSGLIDCTSQGSFSLNLRFSESQSQFRIVTEQTAVNGKSLSDSYLYVISNTPPPPEPPPADCGSLAHGESETRIRYESKEVTEPATCVSETQTRTCDDGMLSSWSPNNFQNINCSIDRGDGDPPPQPPEEDPVGACIEYAPTFNPNDFDHVLENFDRTTTLRLEGDEWDNTLVRNCKIHDVASGSGIFLKNVENVVIQNCEVSNFDGDGIKTSSSGSTANIQIIGNYIHNVGRDGIASAQRIQDGINSDNLIVANNRIEDTGHIGSDGKYHGIYNQSQNAWITGNYIGGDRDGNGISFRSSGRISCNLVEGVSGNGKPGIRYFSDHMTGEPSRLIIANNRVNNQSMGIHIYRPVNRYDGSNSLDHVVKEFFIRDNHVSNNPIPIRVDSEIQNNSVFSVRIENNN